jgi:hypothetical protein
VISYEQHAFVGGRSTDLVEFSNFFLSEMENGLQVDAAYTDFLKAFDGVNHGLLLGTLTRKFRCPMIFKIGSYLICLRVAILVHCFFKADTNDVLDIFENVWALAYADDLKLYMRVSSTDDWRLFQQNLDHLQG